MLLLIPPAAFLITLVLVVAVAAGLLFALGALIASPYLLVRHLRERERPATRRRRFAFARRAAGAPVASQPDAQPIPITAGGSPGPRITTSERNDMKIVVIGGTGLIGSKVVKKLAERRPRGGAGVTEHRA